MSAVVLCSSTALVVSQHGLCDFAVALSVRSGKMQAAKLDETA